IALSLHALPIPLNLSIGLAVGSVAGLAACYFFGRAVWQMVKPPSNTPSVTFLPSAESDSDYARRRVTAPAIALMVAAVINILGSLAWAAFFLSDAHSPWGYFVALAVPAWNIVIGGFVLLG